jgi:hypothetical protein
LRRSDDGSGEEVEGAFGLEGIGDPESEGFAGGLERGFGLDLDHGFAVWRDDLSDHAPVAWAGIAVGSYGKRATAAEGVERCAFGLDRETSGGVIQLRDGTEDLLVAGGIVWMGEAAGFEREGSLPRSGAKLLGREAVVDALCAVEPVESGSGEDESITLAFFELAEASVDVAANLDERDIGT